MYDDYMTTDELAKFIGVKRHTVEKWRKKGLLMPDVIGHGKNGRSGVFYYSKEHVLQLAAVYRKENCNQTATTSATEETPEQKVAVLATDKQSRIDMAAHFFDLLFGAVRERKIGYLWAIQDKATYPFDVSTPDNRRAMAIKAIELNDAGSDVYYSVNLTDNPPVDAYHRAQKADISLQTALITDIDTEGGTHISNEEKQYPPTFDTANSFLPFPVSLTVNSGYGLHGCAILASPLVITDSNRAEAVARNRKFLEIIRDRAGKFAGAVDPVGDLSRVLRVPGTRNYKLGISADAPICHIVEDSGARFDTADLDARFNSLTVDKPKPARATNFNLANDSPDLKEFRIRKMLDYINVVDGEYEKWLNVGFALFNEGMSLPDWEQWSRSQPEFKEGECESKWSGFDYDPNGITIGTLYQYAVAGGYDEKETQSEFYRLHPELATKRAYAAQDAARAALDAFDKEKDAAIEKLRDVEKFDSATVFNHDIITAAAFARNFDQKEFSNFKREIINYGNKHKNEKVSVNNWLAAVKDKAAELQTQRADLVSQKNEIDAKIKSQKFFANNSSLPDFESPVGYAISAELGIEKVSGEYPVTVCRRPVIIKSKSFDFDEKIYKLTLAYMTTEGKWKSIPPTEAAHIFDKNKLVTLANHGLPVTSANAFLLVDFLDAFKNQNDNVLPTECIVPRCGWHNFEGIDGKKDYFVDPRRHVEFQSKEGKNIHVKVDKVRSDFAKHLKGVGDLEKWKDAYKLAKKSPVARAVVAAAVAPILNKILGERNFLLYICAPTRAGKTTALYLAASAIGDEKIIRSFDATKNGLAGAAADVNDYPFFIDEKQVADNRLKETFDNLVYALANGIGRTKLNRPAKLKCYPTMPQAEPLRAC